MPDLRNRAQLEQEFAYGISLALNRHRSKLLAYGVEGVAERPERDWKEDEEEIAAALLMLLRHPWWDAQRGLASEFGVIRRPAEINEDFLRWANDYARKTAAQIVATNRTKAVAAATTLAALAPKLGEPYRPTVDEVNKQRAAASLSSIVDVRRSAGIAVTEVTRGISAGEQAAAVAIVEEAAKGTASTATAALLIAGAKLRPFAMSERDGRVCPICRAKDGKEITDGEFSPFHTGCRCWVDWRII
jgi:hypothetical protein